MMLRIVHYLTALIALSGMSVVYQNLITPWMQPPQVQKIPLAEVRGPRTDESLHALFPIGAWQRGQCRQLQTKDMTLLFREFKHEAEDRISLSPITVIVGHGMSPAKDPNPVIIEAAGGAEISFSKALNLLSGSGGAPPIEHGRIQGNVRIYRAGSELDQPFEIQTSNVGIRNRKVWTPDAVEMQVGDARCIGRDLTMHLAAPASPSAQHGETLLDRVELIYLDQATIPLPQSETIHPVSGSASDLNRGVVSVECEGRLEYDFAIDQLQLHDDVKLIHQAPDAPSDEIHCDLLSIRFRDPTNTQIEREGPLDWLLEVEANGSPASIKSPTFNLDVLADHINLSTRRGLLQAHGKAGIQIRWAGITARLANLVYQFNAKSPQTLGAIDVQGPGIVRINDAKVPLREVQWQDRFKLFPVGITTADQIDSDVEFQIDGNFHASLTDGGEIQADAVAGVFKPQAKSTIDAKVNLAIDRLVANGNVRIDTAAVSADTEQMFVQFVAETNPKPSSGRSGSDSSLRQWVSQPSDGDTLTAPVARARPTVRGDAINVQLRRNEEGLSVRKLSVVGSVYAEHQLSTGGQTMPAKFTGQLLQLIDGGGEDVLEIVGGANAPARFDFGDGFFIGPKIQIRPSDNFVSINQAGEFRIPTAALPTAMEGGSSSNLKWIQPPHCRWKGEMRFDGRTALLTGGVEISASLENDRQPWDLEMIGDRLQVDLVEGVQVRDVQTMRRATVRSVSLLQASDRPVVMHATGRGADGVRESKHVLQTNKLTFSPNAGGGFIGEGPGWYRAWFIPQANQGGGLKLGPAPVANQLAGDDKSKLNGVHLIFGDSMRGDLTMRTLDFLKGVRVGMRPVDSWDQSFDAADMDSISLGESTLDCDQLRFAVEPGFDSTNRNAAVPMPWEVEASRGVVFRTRNEQGLIEGTASRAAYASGKQLFTADGAPGRAAVVRQSKPDGTPGINLRVRTTTIHLGTMTIVNQVLEGFSIPAQVP